MIDDPTPWKNELSKVADRLQAKTKQTRWTDRTDYLIERDFAVGAYAMRKLMATHDASDTITRRHIPVRRFDSSAQLPTAPDDSGVSHDLGLSRRDSLTVADLCHRILHNTVFAFYCGETSDLFDGIYLSSDRNKNEFVYLLLASDFIALCCDIGMEDAQPR